MSTPNRQIRVTLGERESDVLLYLVVERPGGATVPHIASMCAQGVRGDEAIGAVHRALILLHELRFVQMAGSSSPEAGVTWYATAEGVEVVKANQEPA